MLKKNEKSLKQKAGLPAIAW